MFAVLLCIAMPWFALEPQEQEPSLAPESLRSGPSLPAVGSEEVMKSQEAYRVWNDEVVERMAVPFILDYACSFDFAMSTPDTGIVMDAQLQVDGKGVHRSLREIQHQARVEIEDNVEGKGVFDVNLLLDGEWLSVYAQSDKVDELREGILLRMKQSVMEQLYLEYVGLGPEIMNQLGEEGDQESAMLAPLMESVFEMMPKDLGSYFHPAGYWSSGTQYMICRKLQIENGVVDAYLTFDLQEGAVLREMLGAFVQMDTGGETSNEEVQEVMGLAQNLADKTVFHIQLDQSTGAPLLIECDFTFRTQDFGSDSDYTFRMNVRYEGSLTVPKTAEEMALVALPQPVNTMDVTGFLEMGMAELQSLKADAEAEEDMDF